MPRVGDAARKDRVSVALLAVCRWRARVVKHHGGIDPTRGNKGTDRDPRVPRRCSGRTAGRSRPVDQAAASGGVQIPASQPMVSCRDRSPAMHVRGFHDHRSDLDRSPRRLAASAERLGCDARRYELCLPSALDHRATRPRAGSRFDRSRSRCTACRRLARISAGRTYLSPRLVRCQSPSGLPVPLGGNALACASIRASGP